MFQGRLAQLVRAYKILIVLYNMNKKYICSICGKEFTEWRKPKVIREAKSIPLFCSRKCQGKYSASKMKTHICSFNKHTKAAYNNWKCIYCGKIFRTRKEKQTHYKKDHNGITKGAWNKGLTKETNSSLKNASNKLKENFQNNLQKYGWKINPKSTEKARLKQIENYKKNPKQINPRGKAGWYKGIWCDSSWELAYVLWCENNNILLKRCTNSLPYCYKGKLHYYTPDFEINGEIIEIKGYCSDKDKEKIKQYPNIKVLYKNDLQPILEWVKEKYGKDFIKLYEVNKKVKLQKLN